MLGATDTPLSERERRSARFTYRPEISYDPPPSVTAKMHVQQLLTTSLRPVDQVFLGVLDGVFGRIAGAEHARCWRRRREGHRPLARLNRRLDQPGQPFIQRPAAIARRSG